MNGDQLAGVTTVERVGVGEVFIVAGQSNGQGMYDDMPDASDDRVNAINYYDASESQNDPPSDVFGRFVHLNKGSRIAPRGIGTWCWGKLGDLLAQRLNVPILFFNAAYAGTAIRNWRESIEKGRSENIYQSGLYYPDGQPYANLRTSLQFYTNMLGVRAILWHQGEAENFVSTSTSEYVSGLQVVINRSRQDAGKNISWMVARVSYTGDLWGPRPQVISAQDQVIATTSNVFAGPETDGIQIPRQRPPRTADTYDDVHFDVNGLVDVANAWNNSMTDAFFSNSQPQPPAAVPSVTVSCAANNQLTLALNGTVASATWSTGDTGPSIVKGAGDYRAKIKDALGNVSFSPVVHVASAPSIQASGPTTFCVGGTVNLKSDQANNITWSTNVTSQTIGVATSGDYSVRYRDVSGCDFTSATVSVKVNPLPAVPTVTAEKSTTFCQGDNTVLRASDGNQYTWSSGQTSQRITVQTAGAYTLTVTDQNGCTSPRSSAVTVVVNPLPPTPVVTASGSTTFCADQRVTLTATAATSYSWTSGQSNQSIVVNQSGVYTLQTRNEFSCVSAPSNVIRVLVNPLPDAPTLTASGLTTFCEGGQVNLTASSPLKPLWTTGDSVQTITVKQSGQFTAKVRDQNGCFSPTAPAITIDVKTVPGIPTINQIGTYTLEATSASPGVYYHWRRDTDSLAVQTEIIKANRSGAYSAQSFITYSPTLTCSSARSASLNFVIDETNMGLSIYPNPSPDREVTLETMADLTDAVIRVYTLSGQLALTTTVPVFNERKRLDLSGLTPGLYILQVTAIGFTVAKRFIIGL